jgi:hypothetical protein
MAVIRAAANGKTASTGGLNTGDVRTILSANGESTTGTSTEIRARLATILPPMPFSTAGFDMTNIRAAAAGKTKTTGGLNADAIRTILAANSQSTDGSSADIRIRLTTILPQAAGND